MKLKSLDGSLYFSSHSVKLHTNDHRDKIIRLFEKAWNEYRNDKTAIFDEISEVKVKVL
jgi:hypothetical protein